MQISISALKFNDNLAKPLLKLQHGQVITYTHKFWMLLFIHTLNLLIA